MTWNSATDNVGVTGYYVYLNDVALATTAATSFQHTGLTPGTTYNYRVSSYDAAKNNSPWTATPVSATTPLPSDTTTSSQPTALTATADPNSTRHHSSHGSTANAGVSV